MSQLMQKTGFESIEVACLRIAGVRAKELDHTTQVELHPHCRPPRLRIHPPDLLSFAGERPPDDDVYIGQARPKDPSCLPERIETRNQELGTLGAQCKGFAGSFVRGWISHGPARKSLRASWSWR